MKTLRQEKGLTQRQVADATGMSTLAVLRYEQFIYEELSDKLARFYADLFPEYGIDQIYVMYTRLRWTHQDDAVKYVLPPPPLVINHSEHPFETFRKVITTRAVGKNSRMSFCILLAMHPSVVADYDTGKIRSMPNLIRIGLERSLTSEYLNTLNELGEIWYDRHK